MLCDVLHYVNVKYGKIKQSTIFILSIIILQLCSSCYQPQSERVKTKSVSRLRIQGTDIGRGEIACYLWAQIGLSTNKLQKMINGNRRAVGYKLAVWNCGRGLIQEGFSVKLNEVKHFLRNKKPHCLGVIESDLFSHKSQTNRAKYTTAELKEIFGH